MTLQKGDPGRQAGMAGVRQHVESVTSEISVDLQYTFIKIQSLSKFSVSVALHQDLASSTAQNLYSLECVSFSPAFAVSYKA